MARIPETEHRSVRTRRRTVTGPQEPSYRPCDAIKRMSFVSAAAADVAPWGGRLQDGTDSGDGAQERARACDEYKLGKG